MKKLFARKEDGLPEIAEPKTKKASIIIVMIGCALILILGLFFISKSDKKIDTPIEETFSLENKAAASNIQLPTPEPQRPITPPVVTAKEQQNAEEQAALIRAKQNEVQQRLGAPLMLVNNAPSAKQEVVASSTAISTDRNTQFMNQVSSQNSETVKATTMGSLKYLIAEGSFIHANLEPATNSDLPGLVRAVVSEPNYSEDGSQILIPRGSRLLGQYKSGMQQGQSRIFMVWTRLITPSGISIQIGSPGVDSLGMAGISADEINHHFWERFGTASLLSIIGAGTANVGVSSVDQDNSVASYRTAVANSFAQSSKDVLNQEGKIPPTLKTYQGKPIMVFVAKDLDFESAMHDVKPSIAIF